MYTHTLPIVQMLKPCLKISHLAKRVYTHTIYSGNVEAMFKNKNQPSRQTCIHTHPTYSANVEAMFKNQPSRQNMYTHTLYVHIYTVKYSMNAV